MKGEEKKVRDIINHVDGKQKLRDEPDVNDLINKQKLLHVSKINGRDVDEFMTPEEKQKFDEKEFDEGIERKVKEYGDKEKVGKVIESFTDKIHLAEQLIEAVPLYYDNGGLWWKWSSGFCKWEMVDEVDLMNLVTNASPANTIIAKERSEIIQALKQVTRLRPPRDAPRTWLQFDDEVIDLETGDKFKATADYFLTNPLPYKLGINEETPVIDKIFTEWVGKKEVLKLKQIIAYCMLRDYPLHRIFCFIGSGMNGKSKYLDLLRQFIGADNICSTELDVLMNSRFEVTRLHKKLACQMGETNFGELNRTSMLKKLSGGDLIGFEYKNKNPFQEINYAKILIATNNLPATTDKTIGFYRRWLIVDFPNQFTEAKDILGEIPKEEYNALATQCVKILMGLLSKREFDNEGSIEDRMKKYESKSNFLEEFLLTYTRQDSQGHITKADFFRKFTGWCKENRHREMSDASLGRSMKAQGFEQGRKSFDWLNDGKGGQLRVWLDLKWVE